MPVVVDGEPDGLHAILPGEGRGEHEMDLMAGRERGLREDLLHGLEDLADLPGVGAGVGQDLGQLVSLADGFDDPFQSLVEVAAGIVRFRRRLGEHGRVRCRLADRGLGRAKDIARSLRTLDLLLSGRDERIRLGLPRLLDQLASLVGIELLTILTGKDAAQKLDDANRDVATPEPPSPFSSSEPIGLLLS